MRTKHNHALLTIDEIMHERRIIECHEILADLEGDRASIMEVRALLTGVAARRALKKTLRPTPRNKRKI